MEIWILELIRDRLESEAEKDTMNEAIRLLKQIYPDWLADGIKLHPLNIKERKVDSEDRDAFIDVLSEELSEDPDNNRLNRILEAADAYAESLRMEHTNTSLYVREKQDGRVHRIGTDNHDHLTISDDGQLHYLNLQNGDGCRTGEPIKSWEGYEFVPNENEYGYSYDPLQESGNATN